MSSSTAPTHNPMQDLVEKASILIEAIPYIKKFRGKEILIKYGGAAMADPEIRKNVLLDLVFMNYVGMRPVLIHGGGIAITENLKKQGVQSKFVNGLRVTDKETIEVVAETLKEINQGIVRDIRHLGAEAVGLSGHDSKILNVVKHTANGDVGYVGDVASVNIRPMRKLTGKSVIPVVYPVGIDKKKETYNVNADEAAAKIAIAMGVQKLMVLTNVKGILRNYEDENSLISSVRTGEIQNLIQEKVITGGMIPKVKCC